MSAISQMYNMLPTSQNASATNSGPSGASSPSHGTSRQASTLIAWVPTTVSSQAPLTPASGFGLSVPSIRPGNITSVSGSQNATPTIQSARPAEPTPYTSTHWLPSTHGAATSVKKPGALAW